MSVLPAPAKGSLAIQPAVGHVNGSSFRPNDLALAATNARLTDDLLPKLELDRLRKRAAYVHIEERPP